MHSPSPMHTHNTIYLIHVLLTYSPTPMHTHNTHFIWSMFYWHTHRHPCTLITFYLIHVLWTHSPAPTHTHNTFYLIHVLLTHLPTPMHTHNMHFICKINMTRRFFRTGCWDATSWSTEVLPSVNGWTGRSSASLHFDLISELLYLRYHLEILRVL